MAETSKVTETKKEEEKKQPVLDDKQKVSELVIDDMPSLEEIPKQQPVLDNKQKEVLQDKTNEMPSLEEISKQQQQQEEAAGSATGTRAEKKVKKSMEKLGLKPFKGVTQVTMRQSTILITISKPEVYKLGESFVVFGNAQLRDLKKGSGGDANIDTAKLQEQVASITKQAQQAQSTTTQTPSTTTTTAQTSTTTTTTTTTTQTPSTTTTGTIDSTGVEESDIKTILEQVPTATRASAIAALKNHKGDLVKAIMQLES